MIDLSTEEIYEAAHNMLLAAYAKPLPRLVFCDCCDEQIDAHQSDEVNTGGIVQIVCFACQLEREREHHAGEVDYETESGWAAE